MEKKLSRRDFLKASAAASAVLTAGGILSGREAYAKEPAPIRLPKPEDANAGALLKILEKRASSREFAPEPLPAPILSGVLWAAFGINRPDGRRTAPSASNRQEIDIYVAAPDGLYLYDPKAQALAPVSGADIRALTGQQAYAATAAVDFVYVADMAKAGGSTREEKAFLSGADTGFIAENVYLYCAAAGLATVVRASIDRPVLAKAMKLRPEQEITLAQCVGYPKKKA
jgi:nitroreductase